MGERFFEVLACDPALSDALMDKCLDLCTSYIDSLIGLEQVRIEALANFGGDCSSLLSPKMYEQYGIGWDAKMFHRVTKTHSLPADLICKLHSCGPSTHLYDIWGRHPHNANIVTMETRLMPGTVEKLRENLPHTFLTLTFHPDTFDITTADRKQLRKVLVESAESAERRDAHFYFMAPVHEPRDLKKLQCSVSAAYETMSEIVN